MWSPRQLAVFGALTLCIVGCHSGTHFITGPDSLFGGMTYDLSVDILQSVMGNRTEPGSVEVTAQLLTNFWNRSTRRSTAKVLSNTTATITPGIPGKLSLPVARDIVCQSCWIQVTSTGDFILDTRITPIYRSSVVSLLAQTDKAIYKPGQIVRYRALAIQPSLKMYDGLFNIVIRDPRGNRIQSLMGLTGNAGVVEGNLAISDTPLFGDWSITVSLQSVRDTAYHTFTVSDYALPRFEVTVELPPYGLTAQPQLTGTVKAKYTFGQPVEGRVELHIGPNRGPDHCGNMPNTVQISFEIDGEATFSVPREDVVRAVGSLYTGTEARITAFVKEAATGVRLNGSSVIQYHVNEFEIKFMENTPDVFKPGLDYNAYIQVSTPDGMPPTGQENAIVNVYTTATYRTTVPDQSLYGDSDFTGTYPLPGRNITLPANGVLPVNIQVPKNATSLSIKASFGSVSAYKSVGSAYSPGNTFMRVDLAQNSSYIKAGETARFRVSCTEPLAEVNYMIIARGTVVLIERVSGQNASSVDLNLEITHAMAPNAHLLVYNVKGDSEMVADSLAFKVDGLFENEVSVSFNKNKSEPAQDITLNVRADSNSTAYVLAVDQSVLLLKSGNDIDAEKVGNSIAKFEIGNKASDADSTLSHSSRSMHDVFKKSGLKIITDLPMWSPAPPSRRRYSPRRDHFEDDMIIESDIMSAPMPGPMGASSARGGGAPAAAPLAEVKRIRNIFPEAWLWTSGVTGENGSVDFQTKVPDTITSWVASAFATHPNTGLGVAPTTSKLQVFRPFFVSLTYPRSAVRGEKVVVQATVFNYLPQTLQVQVTLKASGAYRYVRVRNDDATVRDNGDIVASVQVATDEQGVVYFPIETSAIGPATIEVLAQSTVAADGVRRTMDVRAEGASVSYNYALFVQNQPPNNENRQTVALSLPPSFVEGSLNSRVKVSGDLIGASLVGLDSLLTLPSGCGEQSMVKFLPDLHVYRYLEATNQLTDYYQKVLKAKLESGYQRQLTYQRFDKGFSPFGNRDRAGSTWLTAMVTRAFIQAKDLIYIDNQVIENAVKWLVDRQSREGSFREFGRVFDRSLQGRSERQGRTAYVLLTLLEAKASFSEAKITACQWRRGRGRRPADYELKVCKLVNATASATRYVESKVSRTNDQLALSVMSLALAKANSSSAQTALTRLQGLAEREGNLEYWTGNASSSTPSHQHPRGSMFLDSWSPPRPQARPTDVLITSYAILTYIQLGRTRESLNAITWLVSQRNARGGFVSTQDTVLGLNALTKFASQTNKPETNLTLTVQPEGVEERLEFTVDADNSLTLQIGQLSRGTSDSVEVVGTGRGIVLVEFDFRFNVNEQLSTPSFDVSTVLLDDELDKFNLMVCTKWLWHRKTGMVVQEISIPSGFVPDLNSMADVAGMKKAEQKGNLVEVYFDEITKTSLCYSVLMTRTAKVANTQRNYVRTYDYYAPADQSTVFYQPVRLRDATICSVCRACCE